MGTKHKFAIGDIVQSTYRGRWVGVITDVVSRKDYEPICVVRVVLDSNGHAMHKRVRSKLKWYSGFWLRHYTPRSPEEAEAIRLWSDMTTKWSDLPKSVR